MQPNGAVVILWLCAYAAATTSGLEPNTNATTAATSSETATSSSSTTSTTAKYYSPLVFLPQASTSVCPSRTVNYITHTLPQQCLRTSRVALGSNGTVGGNGTVAEQKSGSTVVNGTEGITTQAASSADTSASTQADTGSSTTGDHGHDQLDSESQSNTAEDTSKSTLAEAALKPVDIEEESPLDTSKFLSFEEWKMQNLAKVGQSPENVGQGRPQNSEGRQRPINNALDTLGEEGEIELDFGGFGNGGGTDSRFTPTTDTATKAADAPGIDQSAPAGPRHRSKDAGKTCKERFNYASFDCAATILKTNPQCKSSSSVLVENKDSYMLNECTAENKFLIVELCDDILVDTVVVANFEFFSSMFRTFKVSVSDRYPVKLDRWRELGTFEARNTREIQAFLVENPLIWARYLRIEFLTHYGSEFYCPVSLVRVHGTTMMEEFRKEGDEVNGIEEGEEEVESEAPPPVVVEVTSVMEPEPTTSEKVVEKTPEPLSVEASKAADRSIETPTSNDTMLPSDPPILASNTTVEQSSTSTQPSPESTTKVEEPASTSTLDIGPKKDLAIPYTSTTVGPEPKPTKSATKSTKAASDVASSKSVGETLSNSGPGMSTSIPVANSTTAAAEQKPTNSTTAVTTKTEKAAPSKADSKVAKTSTESIKPAPSVVQQPPPPPPQPSTQESFFKSTNKRLGMLETNSSLNIQYIEEQSRILRDAFVQTEKHQLRKTEKFLEHLNESVIAELKGFRQQYDQLWQSTVIELETHREQYQKEMLAISSRLTLMADELVFQKRMIVVQSVLLLLSLGLVVFVRSGGGRDYMEFPLMQQVVNKSQSMLRMNSGYESQGPGSPTSGRDSSPEFRKNLRKLARLASPGSDSARPDSRGSDVSPIFERRMRPDQNGIVTPVDEKRNPGLRFEPPTPESSVNGRDSNERSMSPMLSPEETSRVRRETRSGPATPSGTRENQPLDWDGDSPNTTIDGGSSPVQHSMNKATLLSSSPLIRKKGGVRGPSPLRYSENDSLDDEDVVQSIESDGPTLLTSARRAGNNASGSSDDGDTAGDIMTFDISE